MWRLVNCTLVIWVSLQLRPGSAWAAAEEKDGEVKIEVVFKPLLCNPKSKRGDLINVHYDGFIAKDGSQFYCSRSDKAGHAQWFVLGIGQVIKGLDMGLRDACVGEKRKITVPSALAYGEQGKDPVPPNATVIFEVEVFAVTRGPRSMELFKEMDLDQDRKITKPEIKEYYKQDFERLGDPRDDPFLDKVVAGYLHKNDADGDGQISMKEYNIYQHDEL